MALDVRKEILNIRMIKAREADVHIISTILLEAAEYLESIDQPLWRSEELSQELIFPDVCLGLYYLAYRGDRALGTLKYQTTDPVFWPEITDESSAFVHRLAVRREVASKGVSREMLNWAKEQTRSIGRDFLRLDCAIRPKLCAVYEKNGFSKHSEYKAGQYCVARYEINIT